MAERKTVLIDAGHGGQEPGAIFEERKEKDDTLRLALAVGEALSQMGVNVLYTRVSDIYQSPYDKAAIANRSGADFFVSLHRNAMPVPGTGTGVESLVYEDSGAAGQMARNIDNNLAKLGWTDLGVKERPGLVVLRQTEMPSVLVEAGFLDNDMDNQIFDKKFGAVADAIANGIFQTIEAGKQPQQEYFFVQTGLFRNEGYARQLADELNNQGFPSQVVPDGEFFKVRTGAFMNMDNAAAMERRLRQAGYDTLLVRGR